MTPVSPPITKTATPPMPKSIGVEKTTRPASIVARKAKICTPVGMATASEAAEKKASEICGRPVANMWCTQSPKQRNPVPTAASTIHE